MKKYTLVILSLIAIIISILYYNFVYSMNEVIRVTIISIIVTLYLVMFYMCYKKLKNKKRKKFVVCIVTLWFVLATSLTITYNKGYILSESDNPVTPFIQKYKPIDNAAIAEVKSFDDDLPPIPYETIEESFLNFSGLAAGSHYPYIMDKKSNGDYIYVLMEVTIAIENDYGVRIDEYDYYVAKIDNNWNTIAIGEIKLDNNRINRFGDFIKGENDNIMLYTYDCSSDYVYDCQNEVYSVTDDLVITKQFDFESDEVNNSVMNQNSIFFSYYSEFDELLISKYDLKGNKLLDKKIDLVFDFQQKGEYAIFEDALLNLSGDTLYTAYNNQYGDLYLHVLDFDLNHKKNILVNSKGVYDTRELMLSHITIQENSGAYTLNSMYHSSVVEETDNKIYYNLNSKNISYSGNKVDISGLKNSIVIPNVSFSIIFVNLVFLLLVFILFYSKELYE